MLFWRYPLRAGADILRLRRGKIPGMTRLRDIIRREPRRGLAIPPWLDRLLSVGIVSTDPQVVRRQRCVNVAAYAGAVVGPVLHRADLALRPARPAAAQRAQVVLIVAGLVLPFWHRFGENFVAHHLHRADQHRPALRHLDARHHQRPAHLLHACRRNAVLLRHPELEAVSRLLLLRGGAAAVRAQLRAGRRLAAADRRPAARYRLEPHADERGHDQRRADLLRARAGATGPRSSWSSNTSVPRR